MPGVGIFVGNVNSVVESVSGDMADVFEVASDVGGASVVQLDVVHFGGEKDQTHLNLCSFKL